ncbi:MAG: HAMP domain-containing histidine kinase [Lachnospiraceae bacterium]|nr:HAMP domain-containing histidine kinase [Lachnospiraceae bacterium]
MNQSNELTAAGALISDYDRVAIVDAETGQVVSEGNQNIFSSHVTGDYENVDYDGQLDAFIDQLVIDEDKNKVRISMELQLITATLGSGRSHYVNYRVDIGGDIREYQSKFSRILGNDRILIAAGSLDVSGPMSEYLRRVDTARRRVDAINSAKNRFLTNLSHDIKEPLNGVIGMMEMARKNISDVDKVSRYLENMENQSSHLQSLLNDVLDISSLEDNHVTIINLPMNIVLFAQECVSMVSDRLGQKEVNLTTEFGEFEHPYVLGDRPHLMKVIISILDNAIKFTRNGDIIFFRIYEKVKDEDRVEYKFEVEDTGIGMRSEFLDHIYEPFSQEFKGSANAGQGSGLGLTISKKLIELMDGHIKVRSSQGIGSKFTVTITFDIDKETEATLAGYTH